DSRRRLGARRWQGQFARHACKQSEKPEQVLLRPFPMPLLKLFMAFAIDGCDQVVFARLGVACAWIFGNVPAARQEFTDSLRCRWRMQFDRLTFETAGQMQRKRRNRSQRVVVAPNMKAVDRSPLERMLLAQRV